MTTCIQCGLSLPQVITIRNQGYCPQCFEAVFLSLFEAHLGDVEELKAPQRASGATITVSGNFVGLIERVITRQYDESGKLRNELSEERTWMAPATPVPASQLRALSSQSFVPYQQPNAFALGDGANSIRRMLEEFNVPSLPDGRS